MIIIERNERKSLLKVNDVVVGCVLRSSEPRGDVRGKIWVASSKLLPGFSFHERERDDAEGMVVSRLNALFAKQPDAVPQPVVLDDVASLKAALKAINDLMEGVSDEQLCAVRELEDGDVHFGQILFNAKQLVGRALGYAS